jgi:hypothetical protein
MQDNKEKILHEEDFVAIKRYNNSLTKLLERYPNGCPEHIVAQALEITDKEVEENYQRIIACIRSNIGV